jgi:glycine betaine/choline ABC-type transport system substrate-binding protein
MSEVEVLCKIANNLHNRREEYKTTYSTKFGYKIRTNNYDITATEKERIKEIVKYKGNSRSWKLGSDLWVWEEKVDNFLSIKRYIKERSDFTNEIYIREYLFLIEFN